VNYRYLTIAGSGPSAEGYGKVTIATKKISADADYIYVPHIHFWHTFPIRYRTTPLMVQKKTCTCKKCGDCGAPIDYALNWRAWYDYYAQFKPKFNKPSTGTQAVMAAVQRWQPETIGLIGFDWILDGNPGWFHDAEKERHAILTLTNIRDLRDDTYIHRVRPPRGVCIPHLLPERDPTRDESG
jgi:hypothetical protein